MAFARTLPTTDSERLFVIGWSHGGAGVIAWLATLGSDEYPAAGAVAVYPGCNSLGPWQSTMPVLVLLGGLDDIALPEECRRIARELPEGTNAVVHEYADGRHGFDMTEGPELLDLGGGLTLGRNEEAGDAAWSEIFRFLGVRRDRR
jgi:dienelactone hydrolase